MAGVLSFGLQIIQRSNTYRVASWMLTLSFALNRLFLLFQNVHPAQEKVLVDYIKLIDMPFGELNLFFRDICLPACIAAVYLIVVFAVMFQFASIKKLSIVEKMPENKRAYIGFVLNANFDRFLGISNLLLAFTFIADPLILNGPSILAHSPTIKEFLSSFLECPLIMFAVYNVAIKFPIIDSVCILEGTHSKVVDAQ